MKAWELWFLLSNSAHMRGINKGTDIGIKVAATEMEVIMVDMGVLEVNGAMENSEVIIAKVDIAGNRVEVMAAANKRFPFMR